MTALTLSWIGLAITLSLIQVWWIAFLRTKKMGMVDVGWGFGLASLAVTYAILGDGLVHLRWALAALFGTHGLRLTWYLARRLAAEPVDDPRYAAVRQSWTRYFTLKAYLFYVFQALAQVVLGLAFALIATRNSSSPWDWVALLLCALGLVGELVADQQLARFKRSANPGAVCNLGLWRYSRHPNYFFEWLIWVAAAWAAWPAEWGWLGVVSPALMLYVLLFVTGVPPAEARSLASRGEAYRDYQSKTSVFVPLPPRS